MKNITSKIVSLLLFTTAHLCSWTDTAMAQLRLGTGIQPGLEEYLLEYQLQGLPLERLRGISGCSVGFGAGCNKTGSLLQQIIQQQTGRSYQDLLVESAGGLNNYLRFQQFYSNASAISAAPYSSFWRNHDSSILDSYENSGIGQLNSNNVANLREVVRGFRYAPVTRGNNNLNLREGLIGLKTAYGRTLIEEVLKIPDLEQKIIAFGLSEKETTYHLQQFRQAKAALNTDNSETINQSLYHLLTYPYSSLPAELNRPQLGIAQSMERISGVTQEGDFVTDAVAEEEFMVSEIVLPTSSDILVKVTDKTPIYVAAGVGGLTILILLLSLGSDDANAKLANANINTNNSIPADRVIETDDFYSPVNPIDNPIFNQAQNISRIPEPNQTTSLIILAVLILLFSRKRIRFNYNY
ncbi:hypothetical protein STA3757_11400 [Stanieria sp. NIES-3757]|nr:hypothetical protein STA3757_11400 [Stanieria sp. NIES-3757]